MDNASLEQILLDAGGRQFWIKPWGHPKRPADEGQQIFDSPVLTTGFAIRPSGVKIGDILFVYRIKVSKLMFIAEAVSPAWKVTKEEVKRNPDLERWQWNIATRNWTPRFGLHWAKYTLQPFSLADEYNKLTPQDIVTLGSLQFGGDKRRISEGFGKFIINKIMAIGEEASSEESKDKDFEWASNIIVDGLEPIEQLIKSGAGFGNPETNKKVELAAVSYVTQWYETRGWSVRSVESEKRGYDLLCSKASTVEHVEVKGVQSVSPSFIITANEVRQAHNDAAFVVCVVTSALSDSPKMHSIRREDFINGYELSPLAFRAAPKQ